MNIKINGVSIEKPLETQFNEAVEKVYTEINSKNREVRRSKQMKKVLGFLSFIIPLGMTSVASAHEFTPDNPLMPNPSIPNFFGQLAQKTLFESSRGYIRDSIGLDGNVARKDSIIWHMNDWMQNTLLNTQDFFDNSEVIGMFRAIWTICMSFVMLIIGKKGFDMVKANVLGSTTIGASQLIIRLLASTVMTFLSLDIMSLGIQGSNLVIKTLFSALETHLIPYSVLEKTHSVGLLFWFIGFAFMTVILSVQYWVRQITIAILGILTPVANLSWVVDGGAMLGTVIREFITLITTPLIHAIVLSLGSVFLFEVTAHATGNVWIDGFNSMMVGFSTMFLMICTPTFLRKFTTGSINPFKTAWSLGKGTYGNALKLGKFLKG
jgi:hypothetical protein